MVGTPTTFLLYTTMPLPPKMQRLHCHQQNVDLTTFGDLTDILANVFEFFTPQGIMRLRCVRKEWREAAKKAIVPLSPFCVDREERYNAMEVMTDALPNLQQIKLYDFGVAYERIRMKGHESPERFWATRNIGIISNFSRLHVLKIHDAPLNGRYPFFFNFPLLEKLSIKYTPNLEWDLEMLAGLPSLKVLKCVNETDSCGVARLTGNIKSLRVLKDTLEEVKIHDCDNIKGDPTDLNDCLKLKVLDLKNAAVMCYWEV